MIIKMCAVFYNPISQRNNVLSTMCGRYDVTIFSPPLLVHIPKARATHSGLMAAQKSQDNKHILLLYEPVISLLAMIFKVFVVDVAGFTNQ